MSRAYVFLTIGRQLAKATTTAADHAPDGTPEERSQIAQHVAAVYRILRAATVRHGEIGEFPMLGLGPATPNDSQTQRLERLQNGTRQFRHTFRFRTPFATSKRDPPVQAHLSSVPATPEWSGAGTGNVPYQGPGSAHIRDRCANPSAAWVMRITASDHITMWIAMSYRPHLHGP